MNWNQILSDELKYYPTDEELDVIRKWSFASIDNKLANFRSFMEYIKSLWRYSYYGFHCKNYVYRLATIGWSGNEDIIYAMKDNHLFWGMHWVSSNRGGGYTFAFNSANYRLCDHYNGSGVIFEETEVIE